MRPPKTLIDRVFVVDDDEAVLDSIRLLFLSAEIVGRFFESAEAIMQSIKKGDTATCIVSDVRLPGISGLDLQIELNAKGIKTPLVLITGHGDIEMAVKAVKSGAFDFITKPIDPDRLLASVRSAMSFAVERTAASGRLQDLVTRASQLSDRQRAVMQLAVEGFSNKEIAQQMGISPRTVESYRAWVMEKMGAASLAELVRIAMTLEAGR